MAPPDTEPSSRSFAWEHVDELQRVNSERPDATKDERDPRSEYERDRDRIVHSDAFRRLQGKTQIFASHWADFGRTRLTHTLEVAQIGRTIAKRLGVPEALVEAACLAHDLGHPPFGHVGEKALAECMRPYGGFDANAQSLRIVTEIEEKNADYSGLDLTRGVLLSTIKYPYRRAQAAGAAGDGADPPVDAHENLRRSPSEGRFLYEDQIPFVQKLLAGTGVGVREQPGANADGDTRVEHPRTLACQIMDWADDIAYSVHDLEDGLASGFLDLDRLVAEEPHRRTIHESVTRAPIRWPSGPPSPAKVFGTLKELANAVTEALGPREGEPDADWERRYRPQGALRQKTRAIIAELVFAAQLAPLDAPARSAFDFKLRPTEAARTKVATLKAITFEMVLKDERMTRYLHKGGRMLRELFDVLLGDPVVIDNTRHQLMPRPWRPALVRASSRAERARLISDYLTGLTEAESVRLYSTLFESSGGSPFGVS